MSLAHWQPSENDGPFFDPSDVEHCRGIGGASGRRKLEEPPLLLPIVRQIPGKHDEPWRRQLDGLLAEINAASFACPANRTKAG